MPALNELAEAAAPWLRDKTGRLIEPARDWLRAKTGRLIEAVDPAPDTGGPRVPLDTLLDDAGKGSDVAAGSDRAVAAGPGAPRASR